jgi:hypothetical protein
MGFVIITMINGIPMAIDMYFVIALQVNFQTTGNFIVVSDSLLFISVLSERIMFAVFLFEFFTV